MPATDRMARSRKARAAGYAAEEAPSPRTARLWADLLEEVPLFAGLPLRRLRKLASQGEIARFDADAILVRAGDPGEAFYVVLSGRVAVRRGRGRATVELGPGAYFGELALLDGAPRSATVVATKETLCLVLPRKAFARMLKAEPAFAAALLPALAARVRELESSLVD